MGKQWGLSGYPLSAAFRARLDERWGADLDVAVLSEMRRSTPLGLIGSLRRIRAQQGFVLVEDGGASPLLPVLKFLVSLTRCRTLAVLDSSLNTVPFGRWRGRLELPALGWATIVGLWSALRCYLELRMLAGTSPQRRRRSGAPRRAAFLRTNLWFGLKAGGSVGHIAGVVNGLARRCDHVDVLTPDPLPMLEAGASVTLIPGPRQHGYPYELNYYSYHRRFVSRAAGILEQSRPDFLYHRLSLGSYAGLALARRLDVPLVLEYNGSEVWVAQHWGSPLRFPRLARLAEDIPLAAADLVTTVSQVLGDELLSRGVAPERIVVHPNGVDPRLFDPSRFSNRDRQDVRARYGLQPEQIVCTFIGTFGRWHGVTLLARAIRELVATDPGWLTARKVRFMLVGDGLYMKEVREALDGEASAFAVLTGLVPQAEAAGYLAASDILLSPHVPNQDGSRFFGSPTKLFEYMAMGKAIVASDLEQIGEVLRPGMRATALSATPSDETAVLTTPGDAGEVMAGVRFLVEHPEVRARLGANARQRVLEAFTWEHNVAAFLTRLGELNDAA